MTGHPKLLLCSLAVPWREAVAVGRFNVLQASALRNFGWEVSIFKPVPQFPKVLSRFSDAVSRWTRHPELYELEGLTVHAPRVRFTYIPQVRFGMVSRVPASVGAWFRLAVQPAFARVVEEFEPDAVVIQSTLPWGALDIPIPHVFVDRSWRDAELWLNRKRTRRILEQYLARADGHFASGRTIQELYNSALGSHHTRYLPNGVVQPSEVQFAKPRPPGWRDHFVILCVGSYIERKGHHLLVEAFSRLGNHQSLLLVLVGRPPKALRADIERLAISDRVVILPQMPQEQLLQYMVWSDLFVLPSWEEAFGNVYAEAMASATPVIMTSESGMAREISHGKHGWIVRPRCIDSLHDALVEATQADLEAMGAAGRRHVMNRFSWERNAQQVSEVLGRPRPSVERLQE